MKKWKRWQIVIGVIAIIAIGIAIGIIVSPHFMVDTIKIPKSVVYWHPFSDIRLRFRQVTQNEFWISEHDLAISSSTLLSLDDTQITRMVEELIRSAKTKVPEKSEKRIVVSQSKKNGDILETFKYDVNRNLPNTWNLFDDEPHYIVTGYLFHPGPALFLFFIDCQTRKILSATTNYMDSDTNELIEDLKERQVLDITKSLELEVINKSQDPQESSSVLVSVATLVQMIKADLSKITLLWLDDIPGIDKPSEPVKADAELIIVKDSNGFSLELSNLPNYDYEILAITTNATDDKITTACKDLIKNLKERQPQTTIDDLKVATIHSQSDSQGSTETVLTLKEIVNAESGMKLIGRSYTNENHLMLREALQRRGTPSKTAANAVLNIEQESDGFILELKTLSDLKTIAMGKSVDRPLTISFESRPSARVIMKMPTGDHIISDKYTIRITVPSKMIDKVTNGTKFILKRKDGETRTYTHRESPLSEEWELFNEKTDGSKNYIGSDSTRLVVKDDDDKREYYYQWLK